ncbi:porin [Ralstonia solanacearum]|uniref:porin n=1 Tax=Ralstonia solanacearum TaxID=305 RepID=UPI000181668B|nr:porin [Ralstonia solanacearum]MDC6176468.1 porin [Ralstonia solanacearum]MDC6209662.1 porin [Ralstonia solanacearum]MDC6237932.1 porin [Ralstonia solanacearum]MDD7799436.1 porin [Ralstonia solanacearum]TYZ54819.1 porin [Ralstonia solanacearum]
MQQTTLRGGIALAVLALASGAAGAQSVTLYGLVDTGIEYVSHANSSGNGLVRIPSVTGTLPSRWGLRGAEDLGGGVKAVFTLESGFNTDTGTAGQGGRLFGRQAWVGLAGSYGTLTLGRQYSMSFLSLGDADLLGPSQYAIGSLDTYIPNARTDNTVAYKGTFGGLTAGATYSFGRDAAGGVPASGTCAGEQAGSASSCRTVSAMLKYDAATFGVAGAYEEQRGGAGATASFFNGSAPIPFTNAGDKDRRLIANGYARLGPAKLGIGWIGRALMSAAGDVRSNLYFINGSYPLTAALTLDAGLLRLINTDQGRSATMAVLRGVYALSRRTALYAQTGYLWNSANAQYTVSGGGGGTTPGRGVNQLGAMVGMRHAF